MHLWGLPSSATPPAPRLSSDGAPIAPDRSQRAQCWEARDGFFRCLDRHDIVDSIAEQGKAGKECSWEGRAFEANCASSWVTYFKQRRVMEFKRAETMKKLDEEGAKPLPGRTDQGQKR